MGDKKLVHYIRWEKLEPPCYPDTMHELKQWGISDIVAHPVWYTSGNLVRTAELLKQSELHTPACHALWGGQYDLGYMEAIHDHTHFLRKLAEMKVKTYTLHMDLEKCGWDRVRQCVDLLLPVAEETGIVLTLENQKETAEELEELVAMLCQYNHPQLGVCFDTGHANSYSTLGLLPTLELMKEFIVTCHMHDNYGSFDDHNPPGQGNIDWPILVKVLKACPRLLHAETESGDWGQNSWNKFRKVWYEATDSKD